MTDISGFPRNVQRRLRSELKPDEVLVWAGQPIPDRYMQWGSIQRVVFAALTAVSLLWIVGRICFSFYTYGPNFDLLPLIGVPFLMFGLLGLQMPSMMRQDALTIVYAVTSARAFLMEGADTWTVRSYAPADLSRIACTPHEGGWGDLVLEVEEYRDSEGDTATRRHGFFAIAHVARVERLLRDLAASPQAHKRG